MCCTLKKILVSRKLFLHAPERIFVNAKSRAITRDRERFENFCFRILQPPQNITRAPKFRLEYTTTWLMILTEQIFNKPYRLSQLFFAHFWSDLNRNYTRTHRARWQKNFKNFGKMWISAEPSELWSKCFLLWKLESFSESLTKKLFKKIIYRLL